MASLLLHFTVIALVSYLGPMLFERNRSIGFSKTARSKSCQFMDYSSVISVWFEFYKPCKYLDQVVSTASCIFIAQICFESRLRLFHKNQGNAASDKVYSLGNTIKLSFFCPPTFFSVVHNRRWNMTPMKLTPSSDFIGYIKYWHNRTPLIKNHPACLVCELARWLCNVILLNRLLISRSVEIWPIDQFGSNSPPQTLQSIDWRESLDPFLPKKKKNTVNLKPPQSKMPAER